MVMQQDHDHYALAASTNPPVPRRPTARQRLQATSGAQPVVHECVIGSQLIAPQTAPGSLINAACCLGLWAGLRNECGSLVQVSGTHTPLSTKVLCVTAACCWEMQAGLVKSVPLVQAYKLPSRNLFHVKIGCWECRLA